MGDDISIDNNQISMIHQLNVSGQRGENTYYNSCRGKDIEQTTKNLFI